VAREDDALEAVRKWLKANPHTEDDADTLVQHVRLSSCDPRRLEELQDDKSVPMALRVKLYEYQRERGKDKGEKKAGGSAASSSTAKASVENTPRLQKGKSVPMALRTTLLERQAEGGKDKMEKRASGSTASFDPAGVSTKKKVVLVGGLTSGGKRNDQITYLNEQHQNVPVTTTEGYTDIGAYSVCFSGTNITISGGYSEANEESVDTINQYDTVKCQWRKLSNLRQKTSRHVSLIIEHYLYVIAGVFESSGTYTKWYNEVEILDLLTGKWRQGAEIPHAVTWAGAAVVNGNIVVAGGRDLNDQWTTRTLKYDPEANHWSYCTSMPKSRDLACNSTVAVGNLMYLLACNDFLVYNVDSDHWTTLTAPPKPSLGSAMLVHDDHTLLVLGGREGILFKPHGRIRRYDLRTRRWSVCDECMSVPQHAHSACLLPLPQ
jgi:hypothetical protein